MSKLVVQLNENNSEFALGIAKQTNSTVEEFVNDMVEKRQLDVSKEEIEALRGVKEVDPLWGF